MSSKGEESSQKRPKRGRPAAGGRSTFAIKLSEAAFNAVLEALFTLSKLRRHYLTYSEAVRLALPIVSEMRKTGLVELYRTIAARRPAYTNGLHDPITFTVNLNSTDREGALLQKS